MYTEHKGPRYFFTQKDFSMQYKRWHELAKSYDYDIEY